MILTLALRWFKYAVAIFFIFLFVTVVGAFLFLRASLPQLEGNLHATGLHATMKIARDANGVPTIQASDHYDLAYGLGYLHGQDRFFQMDCLRRVGAGELSELFGSATLELDREYRLYRFRAQAAALFKQLSSTEQQQLLRYTQGVNDSLRNLSARPFEYALLGMQPRPWQPEDSLLVIYAMYFQLQSKLPARQIARTWLQAHATAPQLALLLPTSSQFDAPLDAAGISLTKVPFPAQVPNWLTGTGKNIIANSAPDYRSSIGSNNWAIAGKRTMSGAAIVGNDMHLMLGLPNIWYRAMFNYPNPAGANWRVSGVTLPGLPAMIVGSNGHVAWGFTVAYADCFNLVSLEKHSDDPLQFKFKGHWQVAHKYIESISIHGAAPVPLTILETTAGPVHQIDGKFYAMHWVAKLPGAVNLGIARLAEARNITEAMQDANRAGLPAENIVVGDNRGHIGWTIAGALPDRRTQQSNEAAADQWQSLLPADAYPRVTDPENGQLWTANNRQLAGDAYRLIGDGGADIGARASQVRDDLLKLTKPDEHTAYQISLDDRALFMQTWRKRALDTLDASALIGRSDRATFRQLLIHSWSGHASIDSVGYTLTHDYLYQLYAIIFEGINLHLQQLNTGSDYELANPRWPALVARLLDEQPTMWLPAEATNWHQVQLMAIDRTISALKDKKIPLEQASWGRHNTLEIAHPLAASLPLLGRWLAVPAQAVPGDSHMPRVAAPNFGQSQRMVVTPGQEEQGIFNMPGGQSSHPLSPFFLAGHAAWVRAEATPFLPTISKYSLNFFP